MFDEEICLPIILPSLAIAFRWKGTRCLEGGEARLKVLFETVSPSVYPVYFRFLAAES